MANAGRSRFLQRSGRSQRRRTDWSAGPRVRSSLSAAGSSLFPVGSAALGDGMTLVRIRGEFSGALMAADVPSGGFQHCAVGICNVTENAFGVGATAIPQPFTDIDWDGWIWHRTFSIWTPVAAASGNVGESVGEFRFDIDNKAMRKVNESDVIVGVVEITSEVGVAVAEFILNTRLLDKLP